MKINTTFNRASGFYKYLRLTILIYLLAAAARQIPAQQPAIESGGEKTGTRANRRARITIAETGEITLRAKNVLTKILAEDFSRKLGVPVILSPLMRLQIVSVNFDNLPLEQAARILSPHARIDYVQSRRDNGTPRPIAVYLNAYNEPEPSTVRSIKNQPTAFVIEGETDAADITKEKQLKISVEQQRLTIIARRQSLSSVLSEIARRADVEFDLRFDDEQLIDVEIHDEPIIEALARLSPRVSVYLRRDLLTDQTTVFRISLSAKD